jgi:hypothetical protein
MDYGLPTAAKKRCFHQVGTSGALASLCEVAKAQKKKAEETAKREASRERRVGGGGGWQSMDS